MTAEVIQTLFVAAPVSLLSGRASADGMIVDR